MGGKINTIAETRNGGVKVVFRQQGSSSTKSFYSEVKEKMGKHMACDIKQSTMIVQNIERGCNEDFVRTALSKALFVQEADINIGKHGCREKRKQDAVR